MEKLKAYTIVIDNGLPSSKPITFSDKQESGIYVVQTESGKYFISYSDFVAKEFREFACGIYKHSYLRDDEPKKFIDLFRLGLSKTSLYGASPEARRAKDLSFQQLRTSIHMNYCSKYGAENVVSPDYSNYGKKGFESKSSFVDEMSKVYDYQAIIDWKGGEV